MKRFYAVVFFLVGLISFSSIIGQESSKEVQANTETSEDEINKLLNESEGTATIETPSVDSSAVVSSDDSLAKIVKNDYGMFGQPLADCGKEEDKLSLWSAFLLGIGGGLLALLFPCTFPMIPMTMSFFLKGSGKEHGKRNAILYGFF
jgi:thiol:disulfide interchange protein